MLVPAFAETGGAVFGLGFILWFAWAGIVMVRNRRPVTTTHFASIPATVQS